MPLYLDNSATTQVLPEVRDAMMPYLFEEFGNPSSKYYNQAENAKSAINLARDQVSALVGCEDREVIFTSGSTESNNMIIKGIADYYQNKGNHIITSKAEHSAVLETCKYLEQRGFDVTYLDVDEYGRISIEELESTIKEKPPLLVSLIWGNNETGSLNPIEEIGKVCSKHGVFFHTDATQVIGKCHVDLSMIPGLQFASISAHKFHGPKGIGAAIIKRDELGLPIPLTPLLHGGGQEDGYRSGTHPVHNIVGLGKAAELSKMNLEQHSAQLNENEKYLEKVMTTKFGDKITFNHDGSKKIPGILSVTFKGVNNELLVKNLAPHIAISTGSACSTSKPSHVLEAMGYNLEHIRSTIRISLSPFITKDELNIFNNL
ncbi:aminotransferase class V-fold PLP-dependent enzyme [Salimicrobium sp. PL1-032A]|uniref:cysteine desulfurase family protein n=1 Tax=Salimicrobium sp. PL1-032A TaxID=3095364 RepID=UPI0032613E9F